MVQEGYVQEIFPVPFRNLWPSNKFLEEKKIILIYIYTYDMMSIGVE
jgi:hypothetical protein